MTIFQQDPSGIAGPDTLSAIAGLAGAPLRPAREVRVLRDGAGAFPAMLDLIHGAGRSVCFENFIFADDTTGKAFADALAGASERGCEVRVLYDPVGTLLVRGGSIARRLRRLGVQTRSFRPLSLTAPWSWLRLRHRDHRKLIVVDDHAAVVGGLCISDHWAPSERGGGGWRDTAVLLRGPVALDLRATFERMWRRAHGPEPEGLRPLVGSAGPWPEPPVAVVVGDRPAAGQVMRLYEFLARSARESLEISDAYMVSPPGLIAALREAARRGVRVRLLLPGRNNHPLAGLAARRFYESLLEAGAEIYEWKGVMLHAKTVVADGSVSMIGSSNLDPLSLRRNYELNVLVCDAVTGARMRDLFAADTGSSTRLDLHAWRRRPLLHRLAERIASIFAPNL